MEQIVAKSDYSCIVDGAFEIQGPNSYLAGIGGLILDKEGNKKFLFSWPVDASEAVEVDIYGYVIHHYNLHASHLPLSIALFIIKLSLE